jgi:hypothetical protein
MTLREKLKPIVSINTTGEAGRFADEIEKLADEFAIGFAEWLTENAYKESDWRMYDKGDNFFNTKELLETYKKEQGL